MILRWHVQAYGIWPVALHDTAGAGGVQCDRDDAGARRETRVT